MFTDENISGIITSSFVKWGTAVKKVLSAIGSYLKKSDVLLLLLSIASSVYGMVLISSSTQRTSSFIYIQVAALIIGIALYVLFSLIDIDIIADKSLLLFVFSVALISTLFVWGIDGGSGNKAWLRFGSIGIQPAEVVKIPFIIILARMMVLFKEQRGVSAPISVIFMVAMFAIMFVLIVVSSSDLGSALVYMFIFAAMLFLGGVSLFWFALAAVAACVALPFLWNFFFTQNQKDRILAPYDPSVDPTGLGITWQANQSKAAISAGGFSGSGLYKGEFTQTPGAVPQQHTDFIFSAAGEELGFIGALLVILLLFAIIIRCFYVGVQSNNTLSYLVCTGISAMLLAQTLENIGMCLGLTPVIGLTLPFFSYGGSSLIVNFAAIGIVSGIRMRPRPQGFRHI